MDIKAFPALIVGVVVALVLAGATLPIWADTLATEDTFTNEGYFYLDKLKSTDETEHTISWASTNNKILTIDGVDMDVTTWGLSSYQQVTVFATETDLIRLGVTSVGFGLQWIQIRGATISYASASSNFDATISGGTASIMLDTESDPRILTYTEAYFIQPDKSDYVMKKSNESAYMNSDSPIYSLGYTSLSYGGGNDNAVLKITGNVESVNIQAVRQSSAYEVAFSNIVIDHTAVSNYLDLYKFDKITFTATENDTANACIYSYVIVPTEITADRSVSMAGPLGVLVGVIPLLMVAGLVTGAVVWFINRKG